MLENLGARVRRDLWQRPAGGFDHLDGMRGFASVIVFFYHAFIYLDPFRRGVQWPDWFLYVVNGAWSGIDIFFVLSGFLVGRILIRQLFETRSIHYRRFLIRRSLRIFPAYYLVLVVTVLFIARVQYGEFPALFASSDWELLRFRSWANFLYVSNYVYPGYQPNVMNWGWSLCVEEHFYLVLPLLLWGMFRLRSPALHLAVLGLCIAGPLLTRAIQFHSTPGIGVLDLYYYSHTRFDEIFVGVLIAYLYVGHYERLKVFAEKAGSGLWIVGLACYGAAWRWGGLLGNSELQVVWQFSLFALGSGLLVINGLFLRNRVTRLFAHPAWYPLARISYGTYLIHPFMLFVMMSLYRDWWGHRVIGMGEFFAFFMVGFVLTSLMAALMFLLLERPLLDYGARWNRRLEESQESPE